MLHAMDSFLKFFASVAPTGYELNTNMETAPLQPNTITLWFLASTPRSRTNPMQEELTLSIDVLADGSATELPARKAKRMAMEIDKAISIGWVAKQDWSDPDHPVDLGTKVSWLTRVPWRNVPEPAERYAHLNKTLSLRFIGEKV